MVTGQKLIAKAKLESPQLKAREFRQTSLLMLFSKLTLHKEDSTKGRLVTKTSKKFHQGINLNEKIVSQRKKATIKVSKKPTA